LCVFVFAYYIYDLEFYDINLFFKVQKILF